MKIGKIIYITVIVLLVAVFAVSAFHVGSYWLASRHEQKQLEELAAMKEQAAQQDTQQRCHKDKQKPGCVQFPYFIVQAGLR